MHGWICLTFCTGLAISCVRKEQLLRCDDLEDAMKVMKSGDVVIVRRILKRDGLIDLSSSEIAKIQISYSEVDCRQFRTKSKTTIILADKVCERSELSETVTVTVASTTLAMETLAVSFNAPWMIAAGISSVIVICLGLSVCTIYIIRKCVKRRVITNRMDDISKTEFSREFSSEFHLVKLE